MGEVGGGARRRQNPACRGRVAGGRQVLRRLSPLPGGGALGSRPNALRSVRGPGVLCWFFLGFLRDGRSQHVFVPGGRKQSLSEGPFKSCVSSCREGGRGTRGRAARPLCSYTQRRGRAALEPAHGAVAAGAAGACLPSWGPLPPAFPGFPLLWLQEENVKELAGNSHLQLDFVQCIPGTMGTGSVSLASISGRTYDVEKSPMRLHCH